MNYDKLFKPGEIVSLILKNCFIVRAMGVGFAKLEGTPTQRTVAYYEEKAKGSSQKPHVSKLVNFVHHLNLLWVMINIFPHRKKSLKLFMYDELISFLSFISQDVNLQNQSLSIKYQYHLHWHALFLMKHLMK